ncbi:MAG: hypothetical protein BGN88_15365 [Clostridiales bacterium 43-6]|nr:MAG: hypothetical protein BGN88_15365 [Clostridiales bacterium 43-6]
MFHYFDPMYYMFMLPPIALMLLAQFLVKSRYSKYGAIVNAKGMTGADAAREILHANGIFDVNVVPIEGKLTDNYDPRTKIVSLSEGVYNGNSISAIGIAAHEVGHAIQHNTGYAPIKARNAIFPVSSLGSSIGPLVIIAGIIFNFPFLSYIGLIFFAFAVLFQLITLPVEFDASRRALNAIGTSGFLTTEEAEGAKKVLTAAALTYIAALLQSLMMLIYYFLRSSRRN